MTFRIFAVLLVCASVTFADTPTTSPSTRPSKDKTPATQPVKKQSARQPATARPATRPSTRPAVKTAFPSAREMAERLMGKKKEAESHLKVAFVNLDQPIVEKPAEFALFGDTSLTLHAILSRIHQARLDKDVRALLVNLGNTSFNMAQAQEIRDAFSEMRKAGKRVFVYADSYDTASYIAASGSRDICMLPAGEIMIPGVGLEAMFAKGLLDKVGVKADYVQIGQFKGADESFTRTEPSREMRGEMNKILDSLYDQIVDGIAYNRNISRHDVKDMIDNVMLNGKLARERKFVDHLVDQDGLRELMKKELGREVDLLSHYGITGREPLDFSDPLSLMASLMKKPADLGDEKPKIALIYAEGVIIDGEAEEGILGGGGQVGSENMRKALRIASRDEDVQAIVIRIDSPGGSALASEVMWQAARRAAEEKPVIISIGGMAASGGYYLACAGDYVFADPSAIVGSIGVVGGKFVFKDLMEKVGVHNEAFTRGAHADLFSSNQPFSDQQRRLVTNWMTQTYEQFTSRVVKGRNGKIKDIDDVAHGRIFLAKQARDLGMVDELGGLEKAIAYAAGEADLEEDEYQVELIPGTKTLGDLLRGDGPEARFPLQPKLDLAGLTGIDMISPSAAKLLRQQITVMRQFQNRPVMLVSPYIVRVR